MNTECKICGHPTVGGRSHYYTCKSRLWIDKNPVDYVWHMLKKSAKKRGIDFTITKEYFRDFIKGTDYMEGRGRLLQQLNIDRIDNEKGYEPGNLQVLTKSENVRKFWNKDIPRKGTSHVLVEVKDESLKEPF